ncbi:RNA polymerase subunit sigma [Lysinibacillus xylanilyticus]|uniref:RNA polymerase subunit sigma n=1 Tax=Lysinibacillus xylanilyticus TaxID=582475 RepID=UPI002B240734|nr:RNA polymerase subunit sigma [Lysinibacillus xylanilyticus]MEB2302269.1 RNA polymerase subunit sigma [Lysinibacillus xylanilyticus]
MTHNQFDDDQLEHILNNAPKLSDRRSKEEILNRLLADARLQDHVHLQAIQQPIDDEITSQEQHSIHTQQESAEEATIKKISRKWPIFMSVAAVFAITVLTGSMFMNNNDAKMEQANAPETSQYSTMQDNRAEKNAIHDRIMESNIVAEHSRIMSLRSSVYEDDLTDAVAFHIGLANRDKESVPMTYIIPNERVATDFGKKNPTTLQMYEKYAPQIDEEANGFTNYHPYKGELKEKGDQLVHVLPKENEYDVASKDTGEYVGTLQDTFSDSEYKSIEFEKPDGTANTLSKEEETSKQMALTSSNHFNYYLYKDENGAEYLSPDSHKTFSTVTEALTDMRVKYDDAYVPVIPENITYTVKEVAEGVIVTFDEPLDLTTMDVTRATQLIEAMMLTAASFDQQVRLDNVVQESWEGFDLKNFLPKPVGANKRYMP